MTNNCLMNKPAFLIFMLLLALTACNPNQPTNLAQVLRADTAINALVPQKAVLEILDTNFVFVEGPVWKSDGSLLFSDIPADRIIRWHPVEAFSDYLNPSQQTNGLAYDKDNNLIMCSHGARAVIRQQADGTLTYLAHKYQGKRLNSPNDLVIASSGALYFTDPSWGLKDLEQSADKELSFNGVYVLLNDSLILIDSTLWRPNGITLSPDQRTLYVSDMFVNNVGNIKTLYQYTLDENGMPISKKLNTVTGASDEILRQEGGFDGIKTDIHGNLYCTGPHGIVVLNASGNYLGTIRTPLSPANCGWGDEDFKTLYITARRHVYRIRLNVQGFMPLREI
ncbi:MAG: SMP-30/gluconolactonase/LRE family protein [Bacteroidales bacterium]|nr:SMP-30/gluconolactonase/LRE family protein [Bacteroidales bacterium]